MNKMLKDNPFVKDHIFDDGFAVELVGEPALVKARGEFVTEDTEEKQRERRLVELEMLKIKALMDKSFEQFSSTAEYKESL